MKRCYYGLIFVFINLHQVLTENFREKVFQKRPCEPHEFRCLSGLCLARELVCNGGRDCPDGSDEDYCRMRDDAKCPDRYNFYSCTFNENRYDKFTRCFPISWRCDGSVNCRNKENEQHCTRENTASIKWIENFNAFKTAAINWLQQRANNSSTERWGPEVHRTAVALYLANANSTDSIKSELAYEVSLQLLSRLALKKIEDISSSQLAQFVNAFLVTCIDPRKFHVVDLIAELRNRVNDQSYTNPFVLLTLCNAGEHINEKDVEKLENAFWNERTEFWTDIQAYIIMALACAASQPNPKYSMSEISPLTMELKKKQHRNGTVDNLKTIALVLQALFASEENSDEENFDEEKAMKQLLSQQLEDGSFGSIANTYFVLPVLNYKSLNNISSSHCPKTSFDEEKGLKDLLNQVDAKWYIQFSLWIGKQKDLQRTLKLHVPANTSLYTLMEMASEVDINYKFLINVKNSKPYIYELSGLQNDPESDIFWSPHVVVQENDLSKEDPIKKSPADFIPKNNQHIVYWYKTSSWDEN